MKHMFRYRDRIYEIELQLDTSGFSGHIQGQAFEGRVRQDGRGILTVELDGRSHRFHSAANGDTIWIAFKGRTYSLQRTAGASKRAEAGETESDGFLRAPMPGQVIQVRVRAGDQVAEGDTLLILEAMKMEIRIQAAQAGTVTGVPVSVGEQVDRDQILVEIAP
jgi:3-methylcrotonyl-CoA carboxylase alpha subunit